MWVSSDIAHVLLHGAYAGTKKKKKKEIKREEHVNEKGKVREKEKKREVVREKNTFEKATKSL